MQNGGRRKAEETIKLNKRGKHYYIFRLIFSFLMNYEKGPVDESLMSVSGSEWY